MDGKLDVSVGEESVSDSRLSCSTSSSDSMYISLDLLRALEVYHCLDILHIDTPSSDVSGHQNLTVCFKGVHDDGSFILVLLAVEDEGR